VQEIITLIPEARFCDTLEHSGTSTT
jgi:hypothetical protein